MLVAQEPFRVFKRVPVREIGNGHPYFGGNVGIVAFDWVIGTGIALYSGITKRRSGDSNNQAYASAGTDL